MIEVKNLVKRYGDHVAVDHLSFTVEEGQVYGFLGPNGAGKSTTMNMMTGYLAPTSGTVTINGHDIVKDPEEAKKAIGYLPELPPVYQDMTVLEYLKFVAELKKVPKRERAEQVKQVMDLTGITDMSKRLIKNLSKGYKQRVGFSQAILGKPNVIILDEPTVGLDPKQIIEIRELIQNLAKTHTIILSSHILSEVSAVCDHIMIISHGKLIASDTPEGLQNLMHETVSLEATIKVSYDKLKEVLSEIPDIVSFEKKACPMQDCVLVSISTRDNIDVREQLSMKLYEHHMPIMGMNMVEHSLEDIFLKLTDNDNSMREKLEQSTKSKKGKPTDGLKLDLNDAELTDFFNMSDDEKDTVMEEFIKPNQDEKEKEKKSVFGKIKKNKNDKEEK